MKYMIGTGFFNSPHYPIPAAEFARVWAACVARNARPKPQKIVMVTAAGGNPALPGVETIVCDGNLGNLAAGTMKYEWAGWMPPMIATAMLAYNNECDFLYQEQDCLAFGNYVEQLYADMGDGQMVIGGPIAGMGMPATQSLFLVRHGYIWKFVRDYLNLGPDDNGNNQGERKFHRLKLASSGQIRVMSFGVERDRPIPWDAPTFFAQQWTRDDFATAKAKGLIP